jgi:hypothetical protein
MTTLADWMEKAQIADDGKPGKSLGETSTEELKATLAKLKPTDPGAEARISALKAELKKREGGGDMDKGCGMKKASVEIEINGEEEDDEKDMEKAKAQPSQSTSLTPEKARQMLHEGSGGHGRAITEQQRKFFGAIGGHLPAPGGKAKKSMATDLGDWLEKAGPYIGPHGGKYADPQHKVPWKEGAGGEGAHPKHEVQYNEKVVDHAKMRGGMGMSGKVPTKTVKGKKTVSLGDEHYSHGEKFHEATSGWSSEAHNAVAKHYREKAKEHGEGSTATAYRHAANAHAAVAKKQKAGDRSPVKEGADVYGIVDHVAKMNEHLKKSLEGAEDMTDELEKAKYISRKRVGNRWVYDYGKKKGGGEPKTIPSDWHEADKQNEAARKEYEAKQSAGIDVEHEINTIKGSGAGTPAQFEQAAIREADKAFQAGNKAEYIKQQQRAAIAKVVAKPEYSSAGKTVGEYKAVKEKMMEHAKKNAAKVAELAAESWDWAGKSLDGLDGLDDWLQKSGGLPTHEPKMGAPKSASVEGGSADGGEVAGVGMTSGSSDSAPGPQQDAQGQLKGVSAGGAAKLSDDDADVDKQMTTHKKPIETVRKSRFPADQRSSVAYETARRVSQLQKSDDVYVGPNAHPLSHMKQHGGADEAASELVKSEGFYHGESPQVARPMVPLGQGVLCKSVHAGGCDTVYTGALTACPECGAGTVGHRALPGGVVMGAESAILEKSQGPGNLLRRPAEEPDIKIGE